MDLDMQDPNKETFNSTLRETYHAARRMGFSHTAMALAEMIGNDESVVPEEMSDPWSDTFKIDPVDGY